MLTSFSDSSTANYETRKIDESSSDEIIVDPKKWAGRKDLIWYLIETNFTCRHLSSRTRRPDRALFVPRAKRSQTTPPSSSNSSFSTHQESKNHNIKSCKTKSNSIEENSSEDNFEESSSPNSSTAVRSERIFNFSGSDEDKNSEELINVEMELSDTTQVVSKSEAKAVTKKEKIKKGDKVPVKKRSKNLKKPSTSNATTSELKVAENSKEIDHQSDEMAVNNEEDDWDTL